MPLNRYYKIPKSKFMHLLIKKALTLIRHKCNRSFAFPNYKSKRRYKDGNGDSKFKQSDSSKKSC